MMPKAAWEPEYHRVFVDLCLEQKMLGNQPGTQHILKPFQQRTGARFTRNQLKNHWDTMIKQWKIWCRLVHCSYMKWDTHTNTFGASDQDWANYLQVNPEAGQYRLNPPLFLKKLEIIFEDSSLDDDEDTPGSKRKRRFKHHDDEENDSGDEEDTQSASNFSSPQSKGYWSPSSHELFVELLFQEALKGNRPDSHYPKETWKMMLETINQNTGKNFTRAQLKNHWDCTRKSWKIWCQVISSPIMKWDEDSQTFGATDEDWRNYLKENHRAAPFRRKQLPHADKLATIFEGVIEPGKAYFRHYRRRMDNNQPESPQLHDPTPLSTLYTNEPLTASEDRADDDDNDDDDNNNIDDDEPTLQHRRFNGVGFAESRLQDVEIVTPGCHMFNGTETMAKIPVNASGKKYEYTIRECIECLDTMEEIEEGSDLYFFALDLFVKKEYREIFLQLKNSSLRLSWLLRRQSSIPIIDA